MRGRFGRIFAALSMGALTATTIAAIPSAVAASPVDEEIARSSDASWHSVIVVMDDKHEEEGVPVTTPQE